MSGSSVKCKNCGRETTGDNCQWCGYPLKERSHGHGKKFFLGLALVLALVLSVGGYAYTWTTTSATISATADEDFVSVTAGATPPSGWTAPSGYGVAPSWSPVVDSCGKITTKGSVFWIDPDEDYTGNMVVTLYLTNSEDLTGSYTYLNMAIMVHSSDDGTTWSAVTGPAFKTGDDYNYYLALTNGYVQFTLYGGKKYHIAVDAGVFYCISTSGVLYPSLHLEAEQA